MMLINHEICLSHCEAAICWTCSGVWVRALFAYGTRSEHDLFRTDPDADGEATLGRDDHVAWITWHLDRAAHPTSRCAASIVLSIAAIFGHRGFSFRVAK
jgi:hypothetical protein